MEFYKKGQGYYTRLGTAVGVGLLAILGCYALYGKLDGITPGERMTLELKTWLRAGIPAALLAAAGWVVFKLVNTARYADFMISTEGEMKKVSWSTRKEIWASTRVVVITVIVLGVLLCVVDVGFVWLFRTIGVLKVVNW